MRKIHFFTAFFLLVVVNGLAQTITEKLRKAWQQFEADSQLKSAISSLYVINAKTGKVVFDKNSRIGLAPASTQKIITATSAFELLGKEYRYKTEFGYEGKIEGKTLNGHFYLIGSGDPTLGSWRWENTKTETVLGRMLAAVRKLKIDIYTEAFVIGDAHWEEQTIPDGWIWQDIGNYYGAGASAINWRENQFDIILRSGSKIGDTVKIVAYDPPLWGYNLYSEVRSAAKGTGDNAYVYFPLTSSRGVIKGTIPVEESNFRISASYPNPSSEFFSVLADSLFKKLSISTGTRPSAIGRLPNGAYWGKPGLNAIHTEVSPPLDSIIYWFLRKSINLYGEALIKTFAYEKKGFGSTSNGIAIVQDFWKQRNIDEDEINIYDGSGLSPLNRVTTHAQAEVLKYAKGKDWYPYFYDALPEYNGMKMKSGTISNVKAFCGYHKSKDGTEYIFSFLVNNYNGSSSGVVNKMYKVLDVLKN